jgi:hypothetical protein
VEEAAVVQAVVARVVVALPAEAAGQSADRSAARPEEALGVLLRLLHPAAVHEACPVAIPARMARSRIAA